MNPLGSLLEKFQKLLSSTEAHKESVLNVINTHSRAGLTKKDISFKDSIIYIKAPALVRNEIFMKKSLILKELQALITTNPPKDIRFN